MAAGLRDKGHSVELADPPQAGWGPVSVITVAEGLEAAADDPRVSTALVATG